MSKETPDYFKVGGRSGGPAGPLDRFKSEYARSRAKLERQAHWRPARGAVEEAEQQLADLHGGERHPGPVPADPQQQPEEEGDGPVPADYAVAEREAAPWADRDAAGGRTGPRLSPVQHRAVRLLLPPLRLLAGAVHLASKAVRRAYEGLRSLEREARAGA